MKDRIVITHMMRTPVGKYGKSLSKLSAVDLGTIAAKGLIGQTKIDPNIIDQTIIGNVISAGTGQNLARQIALNSGMSENSTAMTINEVCGSGAKAVKLAYNALAMNDVNVVLAGGTESMSNAPYFLNGVRFGVKFGNQELLDGLQKDGLLDAFSNQAMGVTAENVAKKYNVSRQDQDNFAFRSHKLANKIALSSNMQKFILKLNNLTNDEAIRSNPNLDSLNQLKPAFEKNGTVTAGNSSSLSDGAAMTLLMKESMANKLNLTPIAYISGYSEVGIDPNIMGFAPYKAIKSLLEKQNEVVDDIDLFEINEAFAAQCLAVINELHIPLEKVNVYGGSIAIGHPLGSTGTRLIINMVSELEEFHKNRGIVSMCIGGGLGIALEITRY